jgi:serine protease Do/serine protease DegQ
MHLIHTHRMRLTLQQLPLLAGLLLAATGCLRASEERFALDETPLDRSNQRQVVSYADVLEPARQAVVSVTTARIVEIMQGRGTNPMEEFLRRFYGIPDPRPQQRDQRAEPQERRVPSGLGSGVIISPDGYILTNNHVVTDDAGRPVDEITVHLGDGTEVKAELIGRDVRTDIALLKIERAGLPWLPMADSDNLQVGDIVFAIGNPLGLGLTSTMGIVSATGRTNLGILGREGYENFIQTDAAINRGNSGGALIDARGRLVGINTAIYSQTGGNIGIGFAIPSAMARNVVLELLDAGEVRRGFLGVSIRDLDAALAEAFQMEKPAGALIESVQEGGPADRAGLRRGDVITAINGKPVDSVTNLRLNVSQTRPGSTAQVEIVRDGKAETVMVELGSLDDPLRGGTSASPLEGVEFAPLTQALRDEWNLREDEGLLITAIDARSPYANTLNAGMVILEVNDRKVRSVDDLRGALVAGRVNKLWVSWRGNRGFFGLRMR